MNAPVRVTPAKKRVKVEPPPSLPPPPPVACIPPICPPQPKSHVNIKVENDISEHAYQLNDSKHSMFMSLEQKHQGIQSSIKSEPIEPYEPPIKIKMLVSRKSGSGQCVTEFCSLCYRNPMIHKGGKPAMIPPPEIKEELEDLDYETDIKAESITGMSEGIPADIEEDEESIKKELDLDGIDMMQIPIQLGDGIDILDDVK